MRPVNLIPPEERRGERAPMRTGPLSYVVVAVLAAGADRGDVDRARQQPGLRSQGREGQPPEPGRHRAGDGRPVPVVRGLRLDAAGTRADRFVARPEPVRLGAGASRACDRDPARRVAHEHERRLLLRRRERVHVVTGHELFGLVGEHRGHRRAHAADPGLRVRTRGGGQVPGLAARRRRRHQGHGRELGQAGGGSQHRILGGDDPGEPGLLRSRFRGPVLRDRGL